MQPFTRATEYTTAAAGLVAIMHHLTPSFELSSQNELLAWLASVNLPTRASSIFGLAVHAKNQGLSPKIIVESLEYDYPDYRFNRYTKKDIELANTMHAIHVAQARKIGVAIEEKTISFEEVKELIIAGRTLLLRLNEGLLRGVGSTSKYVVLYGYDDAFLILDPVQDEPLMTIDEPTLRESFETLTTKKKREHGMIVF